MEKFEKQANYSSYAILGYMLVISFITMYGIMFMNVDQLNHIMLSQTRTYMKLLMIAPMAVSMLLFMRKMYNHRKLNFLILGVSIFVFIISLWALRSQVLIGDVQYMKAMIPHHSSAILTSTQATLTDPEVKKLANEIITAQREEIAKMKEIIARIENEK